jgi:hypothetical protein
MSYGGKNMKRKEFNRKNICKKAQINAKMVTRHSKYWCPGGMRKISLGMGGG